MKRLLPQAWRWCTAAGCIALAASAWAQTPQASTQQGKTQEGQTQQSYASLDERDRLLATIWELTPDEMVRAKVLLDGPRRAFSVANLSPIEALGIHARSDAERRKYAEKFARLFHADVERSLAWNTAFGQAMRRLYPNEPVVDFGNAPKAVAPLGAADALGVPRANVIEPKPSSKVSR
ncbi:MAG: integrating conjugative element protein [Desulfovibrionaceae bacterium]|nr:integrating conjugative element protein [Desulfovibrionaceae bacterium]